MSSTILMAIGRTGDGKSSFLNAYLQKKSFEISSKPNSCTFVTSSDSNIVNGMERICIDTQGLEDVETLDAEHIQQMTQFLLDWTQGVNAIAIILNGQYDRLSSGTIKLIKLMHQLFNHPDFFNHVCLVFTKWYKGIMKEDDKSVKRNEYRNRVLEIIKQCPGCENSNPQIPVFFVDSNNYNDDPDTQNEYTALHTFVMSREKLHTKQVQNVDVDYIEVIPETREHILLKTEDSEDGMVRTYYYVDQKRNKQIAYNGVESYSDWENYNETTETKKKTVEKEEKKRVLVNKTKVDKTKTEGGGSGPNIDLNINGIKLKVGFGEIKKEVHDYYLVTYNYEDKERDVITGFDGEKTYGEWKTTKEYTEVKRE